MKKVVISQPFYFPWYGLFEQIRAADFFVHYEDVQYPHGGNFIHRVQILTSSGAQWLTVPVKHTGSEQLINEVVVDDSQNWREKHLRTIQRNYAKAPYFEEMYQIVLNILSLKSGKLSDMNIKGIEEICGYFGVKALFKKSSELMIHSNGSEKIFETVQQLKGDVYITGHGAKNYLDHEAFEKQNIRVEYMDYQIKEYKQQYDGFNQYVSILDLIANKGKKGSELFQSKTKYWKEFLNEQSRTI